MILNEQDIVTAWLSDIDVDSAVFNDVEPINIYNQWCNKYDIDHKIATQEKDESSNYVEDCVNTWHMPDDYKNVDIVNYILDMCETEEQRKRVLLELNLFISVGCVDECSPISCPLKSSSCI